MAAVVKIRTQAQEIAYSRGKCAKQNGESKSTCPYQDHSPWYEFWMDGHDSAQAKQGGER